MKILILIIRQKIQYLAQTMQGCQLELGRFIKLKKDISFIIGVKDPKCHMFILNQMK